tara:strand:+ start:165659 stop:166870 length:1212 start_codon:yes stop_codon:yes gene_type:complete
MFRRESALFVALFLIFSAPLVQANNLCVQLFISEPAQLVPNQAGHPLLEAYLKSVNEKLGRSQNANESTSEVVFDSKFKTLRLQSKRGRVQSDSQARVLAFPGQGASISRVDSVAELVGTLNQRVEIDRPGKKSTLTKIANHPDYLKMAAEAIELPGQRGAPRTTDFKSWLELREWLAEYVWEMHRETPELPIILVGRSASSSYLLEVTAYVNAQARAQGIKPFVFSEGNANMLASRETLPTNRAELDAFAERLKKDYWDTEAWRVRDRKTGEVIPGKEDYSSMLIVYDSIMDFMFKMHEQIDMKFVEQGIQAGDRHMLLTSEHDPQVLAVERQAFADLAARHPENVFYADLKGTDAHDYFKPDRKVKDYKITVFKMLYSFVNKVTRGEPVDGLIELIPEKMQ